MTSPVLELQTAVVQRLASDSDLLELVPIDLLAPKEADMRLYTYIPEDAGSPYIHFDAPYVAKVWVKPEDVVDVSFTLHMWHNQKLSGEYGNRVIAEIMQAVKNALRFKLDMPNYGVRKVSIDTERIFDDANPDVKHAVLIFTYMMIKK